MKVFATRMPLTREAGAGRSSCFFSVYRIGKVRWRAQGKIANVNEVRFRALAPRIFSGGMMMHPRRVVAFIAIVFVAAALSAPHARPQDVAEAARKAKEAKQAKDAKDGKQEKPAETDKPPAKKTYTTDDISTSSPAKRGPATITMSLAKSTITRPGGTDVLWSVQNNSSQPMNLIVNLEVRGPCGFHQSKELRFSLDAGGKRGDTSSFGTAIRQENCAGDYTLELSVISNRQVLDADAATLKVL
jgi:hypothetical protein